MVLKKAEHLIYYESNQFYNIEIHDLKTISKNNNNNNNLEG
jgi:hypothetical protein